MTYGDLRSALQAAISAAFPPDDDAPYRYTWVCDFDDAVVIYCLDEEYFQQSYTKDDDGNVTLGDDPEVVRPVTSYVPVDEAAGRPVFESRGMASGFTGLSAATIGRVEVSEEPLTYHRNGEHSYFQDLMLPNVRGASERLERHAQEMDQVAKAREARAWRSLHAGELEYRLEPNTTQGTGGYFTPPAWLNELFATARRPGRVLADLIRSCGGCYDLPSGVSSINLPIIGTGTQVRPQSPNSAVADQDYTDAAGSSSVIVLAGDSDNALQLLEQSPGGAHLDWAIFQDLTESYDAKLESQLIVGSGTTRQDLLGITNVPNVVSVSYTGATTGSAMYPYFGQAMAQLANGRRMPPEVWLFRTSRWAWLSTQESTAGLPFNLPSPFFVGDSPDSPDPVGGLVGLPVFPDESIPADLGTAKNQDEVIACRPSDLILLEGAPQTAVMREPGSGNLSVRLQLHNSAAFIGARYPSGIAVVSGSGMAVQSGF